MNDQPPLVHALGVTRRFSSVTALDAVDVDIHENEFFALLGPSGCGKTTLLRILAGLEQPDEGTITLDGADLLAMPVHRRPVNLMFQSYALFPHMSVAKNVAYGLAREKTPKEEIQRRVGEVLEVVGLDGLGHRKPGQLSGGQRQRVALARAVVKRPRLLLLDEPLAALDRKIRSQMQTELKRLQNEVGITFVVVTHDQEEAMSMADRIAVMNTGRIEQLASPAELYERPLTRFVADFIGSTNLFDGVAEPGGVRLAGGLLVPADVSTAATGDAVSASLRPEKTVLLDGSVADRSTSGGSAPDDAATFAGTVRDVQFFGGISHVLVDVAGFDHALVSSTVGPTPRRPGDAITVAWNPRDAIAVASPQTSGAPSDA